MTPEDDHHPLAARFRAFVKGQDFPCVGAKSALSRGRMQFIVARDIRSAWDDLRIYPALQEFAARYKADPRDFQSFVTIFQGPTDLSEELFEKALWDRAQSLSDKDAWHKHAYDGRVSPDVDDPHFSLSFGSEAFFIVGLHPRASRPARRFEAPALVFNPHNQFERLRQADRYEPLRRSIIRRDIAVAGAPNPMLSRHGEVSAARQYSGRAVNDDWKCPLVVQVGAGDDGA